MLLDAKINISMDGKGRWMDNVFIERLWRSLKDEEVYLHADETVAETKAGIGSWISFYNMSREQCMELGDDGLKAATYRGG